MAAAQARSNNPFASTFDHHSPQDNSRDEWEDWDVDTSDDSPSSPHNNGLLIDFSDNTPINKTRKSTKPVGTRNTLNRPAQISRVKSRARQKAQNAKAGIKVVTDMSQFRKNAAAAQIQNNKSADSTTSVKKFANSAALQALEGNPTSPSIGSFAWLKKRPSNVRNGKSMLSGAGYNSPDLSPVARPIVIGISVPSDDAGSHQVSPQTAIIETPAEGAREYPHKISNKLPTPQQQRSVWSPDTEVTESPYSGARSATSVYPPPFPYGSPKAGSEAPRVPALSGTTKFKHTVAMEEQDDDDAMTPYTPFEEDASPVATRKAEKLKATTASPASAASNSRVTGWWDNVMTPFSPQLNNPFKIQPQQTGQSSLSGVQEIWDARDEKKRSSKALHLTIATGNRKGNGASSVDAITPAPANEHRQETHSEKGRVLTEETRSEEAPPPYELPKSHSDAKGAFSHPYINPQPVPSPGPITPGLPGTMTSQGGIGLADIPLTPSGVRPLPGAVLPDRLAGSYQTGDHFYDAPGKANRKERQRRRHEKEDVLARKAGGFWRGRGCIPEDGCFGRSGREGRKRRRICLGILGGVIAAIILIVVLVVVLTQRAMSSHISKASGPSAQPDGGSPGSSNASATSTSTPVPQVPSYWLNLTGFPPIPTGVLTVTGPKNNVSVSGCFTDKTPSTAWSCALPKEDHDSVAPYLPTQPEFVFQIQFDNSTQELWKVADDQEASSSAPPPPSATSSDSKDERDLVKRGFITDKGFKPNPDPPSIKEMRFIGNTTDGIKADRKEGEPTPFFISLMESVDSKHVGPDVIPSPSSSSSSFPTPDLSKRQSNAIGGGGPNGTSAFNLSDILPAPKLNPDGTGAPARLFPLATQQPVRLFDRGLPTEHYGFYTYFDKTIYMANVLRRDPADEDGGVPVADASSLVTFAQTRFLVKIWTRLLPDSNSTTSSHARLLRDPSNPTANTTALPNVQPGSMPYPVTIREDMHGGNPSQKLDYVYGVLDNGQIDRANASLVIASLTFQGTLVNGRNDGPDHALGGTDGGTGGCRCEWVNWEMGSSSS
ncbi:hypothetical protein F5Y17DRAFT_398340 [Xylariaceae sp. FL0594]|nr:hypothetical protein F5Y17DRAFT_398340 [Xylariaceae sp. FL0594]